MPTTSRARNLTSNTRTEIRTMSALMKTLPSMLTSTIIRGRCQTSWDGCVLPKNAQTSITCTESSWRNRWIYRKSRGLKTSLRGRRWPIISEPRLTSNSKRWNSTRCTGATQPTTPTRLIAGNSCPRCHRWTIGRFLTSKRWHPHRKICPRITTINRFWSTPMRGPSDLIL